MKWLSDNIQYPADCLSEGLQGRVIVQFIVEKDGKLTGIKALSSPDPRLSTEAIKCVKKMPAWIPGKKDGKTVRDTTLATVTWHNDGNKVTSGPQHRGVAQKTCAC